MLNLRSIYVIKRSQASAIFISRPNGARKCATTAENAKKKMANLRKQLKQCVQALLVVNRTMKSANT